MEDKQRKWFRIRLDKKMAVYDSIRETPSYIYVRGRCPHMEVPVEKYSDSEGMLATSREQAIELARERITLVLAVVRKNLAYEEECLKNFDAEWG